MNKIWNLLRELVIRPSKFGMALSIINLIIFPTLMYLSSKINKFNDVSVIIIIILILFSIVTLFDFKKKNFSISGPTSSIISYVFSIVLYAFYYFNFISINVNLFILFTFITVFISMTSSIILWVQPHILSHNKFIKYALLVAVCILFVIDFKIALSFLSAFWLFTTLILSDDFWKNTLNIDLNQKKNKTKKRNIEKCRRDINNFDISFLCSGGFINIAANFLYSNENYYNLISAIHSSTKNFSLVNTLQNGFFLSVFLIILGFVLFLILNIIESRIKSSHILQNIN